MKVQVRGKFLHLSGTYVAKTLIYLKGTQDTANQDVKTSKINSKCSHSFHDSGFESDDLTSPLAFDQTAILIDRRIHGPTYIFD